SALTQLFVPQGLFVDTLGTVYVADTSNNRVMRWTQGAKQGTIIVGGNGAGAGAEHLGVPVGLSFDRRGNLCVADQDNDRVQDFLSNKTYARKEQIIDDFNDTSTTSTRSI
ncbi:unnamed protein product, partial [Rotaria magnacalcarata]